MKKLDSAGLLFVGLAIVFLLATLYGHRERERFSNILNPWDALVKEVEDEYSKYFTFNVSKYREAANQTGFYALALNAANMKALAASTLLNFSVNILPIDENEKKQIEDNKDFTKHLKQTLDVDKPYDSRMYYIDALYKASLDGIKSGKKDASMFLERVSPPNVLTSKAILKGMAQSYLLMCIIGAGAEPADGKTSNSITGSFTNLFG